MKPTHNQRRALERLTAKSRRRMASDANLTRYITKARAILAR